MLLSLCFMPTQGQNKPPLEYQVKAAFLFNFTRFIQWPPTTFISEDAPFVIGIIGDDPFGPYIDELVSNEQVNGHTIIVKRYNTLQDATGCQLLFVTNANAALSKTALLQALHQGAVTVSDNDHFLRDGGMIRFFKADNRIKIEIKLAAVKTAHVDISAKLLQLAKVD